MEPPAPLARVIEMLTPALLTSLVVISTFASGPHLRLDARAVGLVVGGLLLVIRAPLWAALIAGAGARRARPGARLGPTGSASVASRARTRNSSIR